VAESNLPRTILRIIDYSKLEGTHKDHQFQFLAPHRTIKKSDHMHENVVQTILELWQLSAHCPLAQTLSLTPFPAPPLTHLHAVPSGPVAVTQSRAQRCPSAPCEELQPP